MTGEPLERGIASLAAHNAYIDSHDVDRGCLVEVHTLISDEPHRGSSRGQQAHEAA